MESVIIPGDGVGMERRSSRMAPRDNGAPSKEHKRGCMSANADSARSYYKGIRQ